MLFCWLLVFLHTVDGDINKDSKNKKKNKKKKRKGKGAGSKDYRTYRTTGDKPSSRMPLYRTVLAASYSANRAFNNSGSLPMMRKWS
jgi:hypothetical protein